jgi:thiosulfate/3-mercaptopyruvate sulfurtransferase
MTDRVPPLVTTEWLASRLGSPGLVVADATYHLPHMRREAAAEYQAAHIPGAVFFDIDGIKDHDNPLPHMVPPPGEFAEAMEALGISSGDHVVVYDTHGLMSAGRAWWMLRLFGHDRVSVLDGGLQKWQVERRPVGGGAERRPKGRFTARLRPELVRDLRQVAANVSSHRETLVDARAAGRFEGTVPEPRPGLRGGHVPGSRNLPYDRLIDPATRTMLPPERILAAFAQAGVDCKGPVVCSCGSGVTAGILALALFVAGKTDASVYDGSWAEWGASPFTQVATGPAR